MSVENVRLGAEEKSSLDISFNCYGPDKTTPENPSSVKVYVFIEGSGDPPTYINDRDGTTNQAGLALNGNSVSFHLSPADNVVSGTHNYEYHIIRFQVNYNADTDTEWLDLRIKVRNLEGVS